MLHILQCYIRIFHVYVSNVCIRLMLQVFYLDVVKVDVDMHVAYKYMLQAYVSGVSYVCCKCFI
jgi:Ni,Fe-hydrogenase I cytochrome b subunit